MDATFSVGIDLGTTNSVVASVCLGDPKAAIELLPIPQIVAPGSVEPRPALPSFLSLAPAQEATPARTACRGPRQRASTARPESSPGGRPPTPRPARSPPPNPGWPTAGWTATSLSCRGTPPLTWARSALWKLPAATWLTSPPRGTPRTPTRRSPASRSCSPCPASFDASARELTREAALAAGLPTDLILLEEPQAALYAWLADAGDGWRKQLRAGDTLLVCDIGGGTTDFSLIGVEAEHGALSLKRLAVGNHLLVGGDNMDLALAFQAQEAFAAKGTQVDAWQSVSLWHACRAAKEALLSADGPAKHPVSVLGRGRKLIGGTITVELDRAAIAATLLDGFFPLCGLEAKPARARASGFREIGLPFEADAAVTRHLADFLSRHGGDACHGPGVARPTHLLFNGGVLKAGALRQRLAEVLAGWFPAGTDGKTPQVLAGNQDLDFAVARGAAHYGALKRGGQGVRIRGGTARSYYVGVETAGMAIPGAPRPLRAVCAVPFGMEEGTQADVPGEGIGLVVGEPAHFRFFSSATRPQDKPGDVLRRWTDDELTETDSLEATLPAATQGAEDGIVPVRLESRITELGVLELWGVSTVGDERWKLEFSVRDDAEG